LIEQFKQGFFITHRSEHCERAHHAALGLGACKLGAGIRVPNREIGEDACSAAPPGAFGELEVVVFDGERGVAAPFENLFALFRRQGLHVDPEIARSTLVKRAKEGVAFLELFELR